jgi:hypothetical protein
MKKMILFLLPILFLSGCKTILYITYGIKKPRVEDAATIKEKALKFGIDTTAIVTVDAKDFMGIFKGLGIPDAAIFDSAGNYIEYRATDTSCTAGLFGFIPGLNLKTHYNETHKTTLQAELQKFRDLNGHSIKSPGEADFYVLIYWAVWTGRLNKNHVKVWQDLAKENKNCSIKVIEVNLDLQSYWDAPERDAIIKSIENKN